MKTLSVTGARAQCILCPFPPPPPFSPQPVLPKSMRNPLEASVMLCEAESVPTLENSKVLNLQSYIAIFEHLSL